MTRSNWYSLGVGLPYDLKPLVLGKEPFVLGVKFSHRKGSVATCAHSLVVTDG